MKRPLAIISAFCILHSAFAYGADRLLNEKSRYLRQHASNPVDWYPWGDAPFRAARAQNKLIFLSIGYSTCHWCQVMEEESFSNAEIGAAMNAAYVSIKVDREERPDVDSVYMTVARTLTGDAGWPLNVVLTSDGKPFFAAAYIPKERLRGTLDRLASTWRDHPDQITAAATMVMQSLQPAPIAADAALGAEALTKGFEQLAARFDAVNGGFLPPPKLPAPHQLMFLLRVWRRTGDAKALSMVETTLRAMRRGAIYDQIGFGVHRYAEDAEWQAPHYEKMLSDQALLAIASLEAFQATGKNEYAQTAREIFTYALRELRAPGGAFYSAQDADQRYYTAPDRTRLTRPARDEKVIADWNGLMIAALAAGAVVLDDDRYAAEARRTAEDLLAKLRRRDGRLLHQRGQPAYLDDYAFVVWGLLNLYAATFEARYLSEAIELQDDAMRLFRDEAGRYYVTASDGERLLVRPRETADSAIPSGNSVQLMNLVRLSRITANAKYASGAGELLRATADEAGLAPSTSSHLLSALDFFLGPSYEVVLAGDDVRPLRRAVFASFVPNKVVLKRDAATARIAPFTASQKPLRGKPTAYVCTNHLCKLPTTDPEKVRELLGVTSGKST